MMHSVKKKLLFEIKIKLFLKYFDFLKLKVSQILCFLKSKSITFDFAYEKSFNILKICCFISYIIILILTLDFSQKKGIHL